MDEVSLGDDGLAGFHEAGIWRLRAGELILIPSSSAKTAGSALNRFYITVERGVTFLKPEVGVGPAELPFEREGAAGAIRDS